jgi:CheY-like chemotaxis protein
MDESRLSTQEERKARDGVPLVLIVDDHPAQRHLYSLLTDNLAISAQIVSCCEEAIRALELRGFDVILMDWQMPDVDGLMCATRIRQRELSNGDRTPIVAVTAHVLAGDREKCLEAGLDDYLGKPFTIAQLKETIHRWMKVKRAAKSSVAKTVELNRTSD